MILTVSLSLRLSLRLSKTRRASPFSSHYWDASIQCCRSRRCVQHQCTQNIAHCSSSLAAGGVGKSALTVRFVQDVFLDVSELFVIYKVFLTIVGRHMTRLLKVSQHCCAHCTSCKPSQQWKQSNTGASFMLRMFRTRYVRSSLAIVENLSHKFCATEINSY